MLIRWLFLLGLLAAWPAAARDCPGAGCLFGDFGCLEAQKRCAVDSPDSVRTFDAKTRASIGKDITKCEILYKTCLANCEECGNECARSRQTCEMR